MILPRICSNFMGRTLTLQHYTLRLTFPVYRGMGGMNGVITMRKPKDSHLRVLGPVRGEGNEMAQWTLKANGSVVPRRSLRPLKPKELRSDTETSRRILFDELIERRWQTSINPPKVESTKNDNKDFEEYSYSDKFA
jgi:hypothetical protein